MITSPFDFLSPITDAVGDLSNVLFGSGSSDLSEPMKRRIQELARNLERRPGLSLKIIPQVTPKDEEALLSGLLKTGNPNEDLQNLALERAELIREQLTDQHDIAPERIGIEGFESVDAPSGVRFELF